MQLKTYQILNIVGVLVVLVINYLAVALPIAGNTTGELSARYPSMFTPAGFTFSIWGLIYLLLIIFAIYQSRGLFGNSDLPQNRFLYRINIWFFISSLANGGWIFAWHHQVIWLSMLLMLVVFFSLLTIYLRLEIGHRVVSRAERFMVHMPFSVYLGWITVATIANAAVLLIRYHWNGFGLGGEFWASLMVAIAAVIAVAMLFRRRDLFYSLVIIWAFVGIISKRTSSGDAPTSAIVVTAALGILLLVAVNIYLAVTGFRRKVATAE